jgi:hypothetical protein
MMTLIRQKWCLGVDIYPMNSVVWIRRKLEIQLFSDGRSTIYIVNIHPIYHFSVLQQIF